MRISPFLPFFLSALPATVTRQTPTQGWTELPSIGGGPRQEHSVTALESEIFIIGGVTQPPPSTPFLYPTLDRVEVFSTQTNIWRDAAHLPRTMNHGNVVTVDGIIYILGGLDGNTTWSGVGNCYAYHQYSNTWETLPSMPNGQARGASAMGVYGSEIYIAGGQTVLNVITGEQITVATVTSYNTKTRKWCTLPSLPEGRDHVGGAIVEGIFYVVGGRTSGVTNVRDTVFAMNLASPPPKIWVQMSRMPTARGSLSTVSIGSKIYTFGGEGDRKLVPNGVYNNVEVYDTKTDVWEKLAPMEYPRHGTNAAVIGSRIYIPGGGNLTGPGPVAFSDSFHP